MTLRRLYVHGAGRRGDAAWPHVTGAREVDFVSFPNASSIAAQVEKLIALCGGERMLIFAHSIGAVPVVLAADRLDIAGLVLVEPALYDLARGEEAIERHIAIVTEARSQADNGDLVAFWAILRPLMFGGPFEPATWDDERPLAEHWASTNLPWGHGVRAGMLRGIPTLVATGGWNAEYERIAARLASDGATHVVLEGFAHRPQDSPSFGAAVADFKRDLAVSDR
ncbi:hypothetical protein [Microbacterium sp. H1-D42]|uniref:hypothetical protein n=1 Tax=Microbacterium sp. H1-D42 TaxID=2925844 RepID=UPI001F5376E8|nr:hypothetical protein [Microbacterium sp. H1-D42]UNK69394.1 hypothetical protein MNR00_09340 [Microbacterium sp. H1-D42]